MRKAFHEELDRVAETLVEMTHLAASAMNRATTALLPREWAIWIMASISAAASRPSSSRAS